MASQTQGSIPGQILGAIDAFFNSQRVFILPSRAGLAFAALLLVMLLTAVNYNLGLGFVLTFFSAACALVDAFLTANNLAGLALAPGRAPSVFAGEVAWFEFQLINHSASRRHALHYAFAQPGQAKLDAQPGQQVLDLAAHASASLRMACPGSQRGWLAAPRVRVQTHFPLGFFGAWRVWQVETGVFIYPQPESAAPPLPQAEHGESGIRLRQHDGHSGADAFAGIRNYRSGDSMRQLAWRQIARLDLAPGSQLVSKHVETESAIELCLDFASLAPSIGLETRLSRMTRWVLDAEQRGLPYAFRLGQRQMKAGLGESHRSSCLQALALYQAGGS